MDIKFFYADGSDIYCYDSGKITSYKSSFIENYKKTATNIARSKEWKKGEGALFRGEEREDASDIRIERSINGIYPTSNDGEIVYSFSVNETSGIYKKYLNDEKFIEAHVVNSYENEFSGGMLDATNNVLVVSEKRNYYNSDIVVFDLSTGNYKTVTDGDTLDEDPYISPDDGNVIYFSSRGVGRSQSGSFVCYGPSEILKLDLSDLSIDDVKSSPDHSYIKPHIFGGKLYSIETPIKEKRENVLLEIILIPWRILQGIVGFINIFVNAFSGKSITSGGVNPAKGRDMDSRKIVISGNVIDVEKQLKKNASKKDSDVGLVPQSWRLIDSEGATIARGVADFDILNDGTIVYTDGKHVFAIKGDKKEKLCDVQCCLKVGAYHKVVRNSSPFDI